MFEKATRLKLRFETVRGYVTTEDLWDIPLSAVNGFCLDTIAKNLNKKLKELEKADLCGFIFKKNLLFFL